jgi:DNA polymerase
VWLGVSPRIRNEVEDAWLAYGKSKGVKRRAWYTAEAIKRPWREAHPETVRFWKRLEKTAIEAVKNPGKAYKTGSIIFVQKGSFLFCKLPSGRPLCYAYPKIAVKYTDARGNDVYELSYMGLNQYTKKWERITTYGGKLAENATQATARDVMVEAMIRIEATGRYPLILTVHDELVPEVPKGSGSLEEFLALMEQKEPWMSDLPLAVDGWRGERYRK